nr:PREDICTED: doublecortin domain-containing protein 2 isoform X2 [Latimeria chalumnae]|eukprot:XP_006011879.1 PREDICTED: doublecortin domain-containing protein 2 isoform X2 [Latimeria chalumnae]
MSNRSNFLSQPVVKNVLVYRNGDPYFEGRKLVINEKKVASFEVFLKEVTGGVQATFGAVRNIYTPRDGHRVQELEQLQSGEHYVAAGKEKFKKMDYCRVGVIKQKTNQPVNLVKPVAHSRIIVSARFKRPIQEPCIIFVLVNGDILNSPIRLLIPRRILTQWEKILEMITEKTRHRTGAVRRLYTLDGKTINEGSELETGQFYVAVGRDKFKKLPYGDLIFSKPSPRRYNGSKASSLPPIPFSKKLKNTASDSQIKSTGSFSDVGDTVTSPQPPPRKEKKEQFVARGDRSKAAKWQKIRSRRGSSLVVPDNEEGVFKADEKRPETRGADEVQEDEDTQVELPVDQRPAETVEEEDRGPHKEKSEEKDGLNNGILHVGKNSHAPNDVLSDYEEEEADEESEETSKLEEKEELHQGGEETEDEADQIDEEINGGVSERAGEKAKQVNDMEDPYLGEEEDEETEHSLNSGEQSKAESPVDQRKTSYSSRSGTANPQENKNAGQANE